jgi:hypothetical protein
MKSKALPLLLLLQCFFYACNSDDRKESPKSENDIDAARNFLRAALDGNFNEAKTYLLVDSSNIHYIEVAERNYTDADSATKSGYRVASINVHEVDPVNDSTTIVIYSNSFKNNHDSLKIVRLRGQWLVDLKYLYEHDMDTLHLKTAKKDTLK